MEPPSFFRERTRRSPSRPGIDTADLEGIFLIILDSKAHWQISFKIENQSEIHTDGKPAAKDTEENGPFEQSEKKTEESALFRFSVFHFSRIDGLIHDWFFESSHVLLKYAKLDPDG